MQNAAHIQMAIELLEATFDSHLPTDRVMAVFFKQRRFMGSKDKAAVSGMVYGIQRQRASLGFACDKSRLPQTARALVVAYLMLNEAHKADDIKTLFSGEKFAPKRLDTHELTALKVLPTVDFGKASAAVKGNFPSFLKNRLTDMFGDTLVQEMQAMNSRAPADVRTNTLKTTQAHLQQMLQEQNMACTPTPFAPFGLRITGRNNLFGTQAFKDGLFEVQDEGSQLLVALCNVQPGHTVVDYCAGAGGKTLGLAAAMGNKGVLYACDIHSYRLEELKKRARRAGVHNLRIQLLEGDRWLKKHSAAADVVLVDAPCTGSGTWRRNPDMKWKLTEADITEMLAVQQEVLTKAATLVKPGGRLVYATCSILPEENGLQVEKFLAQQPGFRVLPLPQAWPAGSPLVSNFNTQVLQLSPFRHQTDGFFGAVFERIA